MIKFKRDWFYVVAGLVAVFFVLLFLLLLIAPKQDARNRGFAACSQQLLQRLEQCEHRLWCSGRVIVATSRCDIAVVWQGFFDWIDGKQPYPWSNYIYEPEIVSLVDEDARREYLKQYPDTKQEMEKLHILRKELENEQNTQQNIQDLWPEE